MRPLRPRSCERLSLFSFIRESAVSFSLRLVVGFYRCVYVCVGVLHVVLCFYGGQGTYRVLTRDGVVLFRGVSKVMVIGGGAFS